MAATIFHFPNGLTVKELKDLIKDWPESEDFSGEPSTVWIETGRNKSGPVFEVWPLNKREKGSDILFTANAFTDK